MNYGVKTMLLGKAPIPCIACSVAKAIEEPVPEGKKVDLGSTVGNSYASGVIMGVIHTALHLEGVARYILSFCRVHQTIMCRLLHESLVKIQEQAPDSEGLGRLCSIIVALEAYEPVDPPAVVPPDTVLQ